MCPASIATRVSARRSITTVCAWSRPRRSPLPFGTCWQKRPAARGRRPPGKRYSPASADRCNLPSGGAMYTLGINAAFHDPAACLVQDGVVLAAVEEERLNHVKHGKRPVPFSTWELPFNAIDYCLREAGIRLVDV